MSKLSFRARALDASKLLPIYLSEEVTESADVSLINRAVPQMPTGMEKEEEAEHHLQQAIVSGTVIPTPEVFLVESTYYDRLFPENYKMPRQLIYMQPFSMETDIPDYDMDAEDEAWVRAQADKLELTPAKFEEMMDSLEKGSGQTVVTLQEAKALIKEDDDLIIAVYDYWLNKRLKTHTLIPHVKTEARHGIANHNPYIAFRRRTEKMQTRKHRKNDETSYEKMLKLRRDLSRAVNLLEMVKKREKSKKELLQLTIEVFEKRMQAGDYAGQVVSEALQQRPLRPAFTPLFQPNSISWKEDSLVAPSVGRKERRQYKKRRHKSTSKAYGAAAAASLNYPNAQGLTLDGEGASSEEDLLPASPSEEEEDEGVFAFRRKKNCEYQAPLEIEGPSYSKEELQDRLKFYPTFVHDLRHGGNRPVGPCRRRIGRGGRVMFDRMTITDLQELFRVMGYDPSKPEPESPTTTSDKSQEPPSESSNSVPPAEVKVKQEFPDTTTPSIVSTAKVEDYSTSQLGCWHNFRPRAPNPIDTGEWLVIPPSSSESETSSGDESMSEEEESDESIQAPDSPSCPLLKSSYHLGLAVSSGERPITYPLETLMSDPPLYQNALPSHLETPDDHVILDEQSSELENTYYLMESNSQPLNVDVEADPWLSSSPMDMDVSMEAVSSTTTDDKPPSSPPTGAGPPPPPPSSSTSGSSSSTSQPSSNTTENNPPPSQASSCTSTSSTTLSSNLQGSNPVPPPNSSSSSPQHPNSTQPDCSTETAVVNVKSGEETDGGKSDTDASKNSRELNRFALLISV